MYGLFVNENLREQSSYSDLRESIRQCSLYSSVTTTNESKKMIMSATPKTPMFPLIF